MTGKGRFPLQSPWLRGPRQLWRGVWPADSDDAEKAIWTDWLFALPPVEGTGAGTGQAPSASGSGTETFTGTGAGTQAASTASGTGLLLITGTGAGAGVAPSGSGSGIGDGEAQEEAGGGGSIWGPRFARVQFSPIDTQPIPPVTGSGHGVQAPPSGRGLALVSDDDVVLMALAAAA